MDGKSEDTNAPRKKMVDLTGGADEGKPDPDAEGTRVLASGVTAAVVAGGGAEAVAADEEQAEPESWGSFALFVLKLALAVLIFRSFIFSPFSIPSESMLPRFMNGDYLVAAKWPYGFSNYSMPFNMPVIPGRIFASEPERGDVVIFKHPIDGTDYIKRVIGLPGDTIEVREGRVVLNGEMLEYASAEPLTVALSENTRCHPFATRVELDGEQACRYEMLIETLPSGRSHAIIDMGEGPNDTYGPRIVPENRLFVMGDHRDNSQDSRVPASAGGGVGLVPQENLVGRASMIVWSTDGGAEWIKPWTWFTAARWSRMGSTI